VLKDKLGVFTFASLLGGLAIAIVHHLLSIVLVLSVSEVVFTLLSLQLPTFIGSTISNIVFSVRTEHRRLINSSQGLTRLLWGLLTSVFTVLLGAVFFTLLLYGFIFLQTLFIPSYYLREIWSISKILMALYSFFIANVLGGLIGGVIASSLLYIKGLKPTKPVVLV
jgi:hypothetical protein